MMRNRTVWMRQFAAILFISLLPVYAATAPVHRRPTAASSKAGAKAALPDAVIERDLRARLAKSKKISADKFQVHVQGGVATIEGRTDVVQHKGTATRMAKSAGAKAVVNRIQVSQAARDRAAANLEKGRRRAQVKRGDARSENAQARNGR